MRNPVLAVCATLLLSAPVRAQNPPLAGILPGLLLQSMDMTSATGNVAGNPHEAHFVAAITQISAPWALNGALVGQLSTFPIASSSSGFVFNYDPESGLFKPASPSFGSGFAERALTNGRGRFGFGLNYQHTAYESFDGVDLKNGNLAFVMQHNNCCAVAGNAPPDPQDPFFEGDLVTLNMALDISSDITAPFASYGLTNRWDVGVVVPIVKVQLAATMASTIDRLSTSSNTLIHSWDGNGQTTKLQNTSGSATGIGDVVIRTKYRFVDAPQGGVAGGLDLRLPTGDKENLLGTGAVQAKVQLIASGEFSRVGPHVNIGYTFSHGDLSSTLITPVIGTEPANPATQSQLTAANGVPVSGISLKVPNEVNYTAGIDVAAHRLLTLSADVIGRTLVNRDEYATTAQSFQYRTANSGPLQSATENALAITGRGNLNLLLGVVGAKFNIPGSPLLITANVLFPVNSNGLKPKVTPVIGLDYSIGK